MKTKRQQIFFSFCQGKILANSLVTGKRKWLTIFLTPFLNVCLFRWTILTIKSWKSFTVCVCVNAYVCVRVHATTPQKKKKNKYAEWFFFDRKQEEARILGKGIHLFTHQMLVKWFSGYFLPSEQIKRLIITSHNLLIMIIHSKDCFNINFFSSEKKNFFCDKIEIKVEMEKLVFYNWIC